MNYDELERELTGHSHDEADYSKWADYEPDGESPATNASAANTSTANTSAANTDEYETHEQGKRA